MNRFSILCFYYTGFPRYSRLIPSSNIGPRISKPRIKRPMQGLNWRIGSSKKAVFGPRISETADKKSVNNEGRLYFTNKYNSLKSTFFNFLINVNLHFHICYGMNEGVWCPSFNPWRFLSFSKKKCQTKIDSFFTIKLPSIKFSFTHSMFIKYNSI